MELTRPRQEIKSTSFGWKAFIEQGAAFLRIKDAHIEPIDDSAVHLSANGLVDYAKNKGVSIRILLQ